MLNWLKKHFVSPKRLNELGVLGLNERNLACISAHNPRKGFPLVDDKLQTKLLAQDYQIATPALLGVIRHQAEIAKFERYLPVQDGFVIKPAQGSGGKGILVIQSAKEGRYLKASGEWVTQQTVQRHLSNLISGLYSLGGHPDVALIESLIHSSSDFADFTFEGVPDIRVIIYHGYPVMAMMRLSTRDSDGKANLHQGAIGVGIDLKLGTAIQAVQHDRPVYLHPDTGSALHKLRIQNWQNLLELAARCYDMTGLGYLGADLVVDAELGPLLLELNARPGLAIQMANGTGLKPRLQAIDQHRAKLKGPTENYQTRVNLAQQLFTQKPLFTQKSPIPPFTNTQQVCSIKPANVECNNQ
ncbi:MAG TPA: alpha-L-glutamate ligase-like protein [Marinospirillum sp.]|uniref:alpha-L-glutamate ligase-like protein n=1 Tax=Marinospirillum sp. TaxID=2183934 RepID=UPI002B47BF69|nr:alpha-L-glutamate ligase-like protein [Marinospirillum sp.]HKM16193.1 alpha-L-glutamate ligase-like protein [Marinospirillum sp.]